MTFAEKRAFVYLMRLIRGEKLTGFDLSKFLTKPKEEVKDVYIWHLKDNKK